MDTQKNDNQEKDIDLLDFTKVKKAKKPKVTTTTQTKEETPKVNHQERYIDLLKRIRKQLQDNNPELASKSKIVIKPPIIDRLPKKSIIKNFGEICFQLNRDQQHVMNFFLSELCAEGSIAGGDGNEKQSQLTIKNRLQAKNVQSLFIKYIKEFVRCQPCGSQNTILQKDRQTRLEELQCQACKATRKVAQIKKRA